MPSVVSCPTEVHFLCFCLCHLLTLKYIDLDIVTGIQYSCFLPDQDLDIVTGYGPRPLLDLLKFSA
jgi:hypothetical protein